MWWQRKEAPSAQPIAAPGLSALEERIEKLERRQKVIDLDVDQWFTKFRTLYARLEKHAQAEARQGPQDAPGTTIAPPEGVTPPPPPDDRHIALRRFKQARRA